MFSEKLEFNYGQSPISWNNNYFRGNLKFYINNEFLQETMFRKIIVLGDDRIRSIGKWIENGRIFERCPKQ